MDKNSFYLLLGSLVSTALVGCSDGEDEDECPHFVVVKSSVHDADPKAVCERLGPAGRGMIPQLGLVSGACAELCEDATMNFCEVPQGYLDAYARLNVGDAGTRQCPSWDEPLTLGCTHEEVRGKQHKDCPVAGRRPAGLSPALRRTQRCEVADFLARAAHLEAASVHAFEKLAADLRQLGAPTELIDECFVASREETEHARTMEGLARARGACPPPVEVLPRACPSLLELARENAVEGVVREAYGALQAKVSAHRASAADVREAMEKIAADEASHAWLALRIARWLDTQLTSTERAQVERAKRAAIAALRNELAHEPAEALQRDVGIATREEAERLVEQLEQNVWSA